ncbi:MAG: leucine-rich repeat domain-containing protein [Bacilli bacterium]|nr:leucine-rich repeat domain-containing protein [Bacilli bacterium]
MTSIGQNTFKGCSPLESIAIPSNIISIREKAFEGCGVLTKNARPDRSQRDGSTNGLEKSIP